MTHKIKLSKYYADAVLSGQKNFEIRYNDRGYQRGDKVQFTVMDGMFHEFHPLENETYLITYLVHGYGLEKDWCVFGIKPLKDREGEDI
jgi:ParB family chromosome partitioning protein